MVMAQAGVAERRISVAIVEDEPLARDLLRTVLSRSSREIEVIGAFPDQHAALVALPDLRPEVVVFDVDSTGVADAVQSAARFREFLTKGGMIFLTREEDLGQLSAAAQALQGGWSCVLKESANALSLLERAIRNAAAGFVALDGKAAAVSGTGRTSRLARLTLRQRQVLSLLAQGLTNAAIAERLGVSEKTVKNYVNVLYQELGIDREDGLRQPRVQATLIYMQEHRR